MSRIGKREIIIPSGVNVEISGKNIKAQGPLGTEELVLIDGIGIVREDDKLNVVIENIETDLNLNAMHGLFRSLVFNIITGVSTGFEKDLEIVGVGYRALQKGTGITFQLGYSHDIEFPAPEGITLQVVDATKVKVKGTDKQKVGQVAANIRKLRAPEPYKGKGIKYKGEYILRKAGKAGKK